MCCNRTSCGDVEENPGPRGFLSPMETHSTTTSAPAVKGIGDEKTCDVLPPMQSRPEPAVETTLVRAPVTTKTLSRDDVARLVHDIYELSESLHEFMSILLLMSGDVESNPGPRGKKSGKRRSTGTVAKKQGSYMVVPGVPVRGVSGKGGFMDWIGYVPRVLGAGAGFMKNGISGVKTGWDTGAGLSKSLGLGRYRVGGRGDYAAAGGDPGLVSGSTTTVQAAPVPVMHSGEECFNLHRREYLGDVISSATANAFSITALQINPGLDDFLVWGSSVFKSFQEYCIEGMMIQFISSCSAYASAGAIGTVTIGADYNATAATPATQTELEYLSGTRLAKASDNLDFYLECDPKKTVSKNKFVRCGDIAAGEDLRLYDWGKLYLASNGVPTASLNLGKIYVVYNIKAFKPKVGAALGLNCAQYYSANHSNDLALGTIRSKIVDSIGATITQPTATCNRITLRRGTYGKFCFDVAWCGGAGVALHYPTITSFNLTGMGDGWRTSSTAPGAASRTTPVQGETATTCTWQFYASITDPGVEAYLDFTNVGATTALPVAATTHMQLTITEVPTQFP